MRGKRKEISRLETEPKNVSVPGTKMADARHLVIRPLRVGQDLKDDVEVRTKKKKKIKIRLQLESYTNGLERENVVK